MEIRPIRTEADYAAAIADKLDILVTLVEKYENEHWPVDASRIDPVDLLNLSRHRRRPYPGRTSRFALLVVARVRGAEQEGH
jgi:antitoxin component HigA of HigAB toxin-antitoxin module